MIIGKFEHHAQAHRFAFECDARSAACGHGHGSTKGGTDRGADSGNFIFSLEGANAVVLVLGQLVQNVRGGRDGIGSVEQFLFAEFRCGDQAPSESLVSHDVAVGARLELCGFDLIALAELFGRFAERPSSSQGRDVGRSDIGFLSKLGVDETQVGSSDRPNNQ